MYFTNYISSNIFNFSNIFNGHPNEIKEEVENQCDDKGKINESIVQKLGKNLKENNKGFFGNCKKSTSQIVTKIWEKSPKLFKKIFYNSLIKELKLQAITSLTSESTSPGAAASITKTFILEVLEEYFKDHPILEPYRDYNKNPNNPNFPLKNVGDFIFVEMGTSKHHITGIITYTGKDQYSLTVINTGEGIERHPSLESEINPIYYTRYHLTGIEENKMAEFIKSLKKNLEAPSSEIGCQFLYDAINDLQGEFDSKNSYTDYLQRGGSCSARQELLIAKHMMNQKDYRQLKIFLSQTGVLELADIYTSGTMSSKDKVIFLDCVQRLKKRYMKNDQEEMAAVMKETELNIKTSLSIAKEEIEPKMFGVIPQTDQHASDELKSFIKALRNLQMGDFNGFEENMKGFHGTTKSIFLSKDYPEENLENNKKALKILYKAFVIFAENCTDKNYKNYSKEEIRAISSLSFYFHLFMNDENITLISSDEEELISNKNSYEKYLNMLDKFVEWNDPKGSF